MAPSLQGLIDFVLNEVALCGSQGGTLPGVLESIETFYRSAGKDANQRQQTVDRRFQVKAWSWLTRNPEVSVGKDRELNHLSLDEVEDLDKQKRLEAKEATGDQDQSSTEVVSYVRIFVSNERTWLAIAGHEPDESKIPKAEWGLLSVIASYKSKGVAQTELVRVSGQDKRSVPKRTDALATKGYIEKRAVQVKSARTSLCTLRRFLPTAADQPSDQQPPSVSQDSTLIDFDVFTNNLFGILKKFGIISRNDLKKALGFNDRWRWRILSRALRKFERIGVLKRVSAESQYKRFHPCVMLLREPTERDMEKFHEFTRISMIKDDEGAELDEDMEMEGAENKTPAADEGAALDEGMAVENAEKNIPVADQDAVVVKTEENVVDAGRIVPCWTPDRNLSNQIFEVIDKSGTTGITNLDLNRILFGTYYRRPSESALHRLVDCWQLSQPLHLRHLAIVRDTAIEKTVFYYIHYSARNFAQLVESGQAVWEAVEFQGKGKSNDIRVPPAGEKPRLDQYGFPAGLHPGLLKNGNASLFEGIAACKPSNYLLSSSDPMVVQLPDGRYTIQSRLVKSSTGTPVASPVQVRRQGRPLGALDRSTRRRRGARDSSAEATPVEEVVELPPEALFTTTRTFKPKRKNFGGLSKKEKFEAMGMDETWVEYNVLLMDRPTPGVYVTPEGKRRPAGKKQGRPPKSRLAVFTSDKLRSLPWFVREQGDSDVEPTKEPETAAAAAHESALPVPSAAVIEPEDLDTPMAEGAQISTRRAKRAQAALDQPSSPTPGAGHDHSRASRARPSKKPRLDVTGPDVLASIDSEGTLPDIVTHEGPKEPVPVTGKAKKVAAHPLDTEEIHETAPKRRRITSPGWTSVNGPSQVPASRPEHPSASPVTPLPEDVSMQRTPSTAPETTGGPVDKVYPAGDRGGSIGLLRRRIVMDIVEKAGGAYPSGTEIWYPFATAWLKMNRKEKPDLRTIKTAIKHLVDTGKLKQLTFGGRDSKGIMVTKTIVAKPEMSPDDPLIKEMQRKVLATDRRETTVSYSPHVETDPTLTKSGGTPTVQKFHLPVVPGKTVQLQEKPAVVRNEERRRERMIHRALLQQMAGDTEEFDENEPRRAERLMTILRPSGQDPLARTQTSISRPITRPRGRPKVPLRAVAIIAAFAMFMDPGQSYHPSTGTFGTGFLPGTRRPRGPTKKPLGNISKRLEELAQMARDTEDPWSTANKILRWELQHEGLFDAILDNQPYIEQAIPNHTFHAAPIAGKIRFDIDQPAPAPSPVRTPMTTRYRYLQPRGPPRPLLPRRLDRVETSVPVRKEVAPESVKVPFRRQRHYPPLPETLLRKLIAAIVAVRVLAGGAEGKLCDWDLVAAAFPSEDRIYIQEQAKRVLSRNRLQIMKMQRDFQDLFIEAYAKDQVPKIDYNHLEQYNWPAVIEWANMELEVSISDKLPSLPATREQFDSIFELREEPIATGDELYGTASTITIISKTRTTTRVPFAVPLERKSADRPGPRKAELARLEVAKSWVRANIVTPEQEYRPEEARMLLDRFGEPLVNSAVQSLLVDRVIGNRNRGRVIPGRNFDITEHLLQQINRKRTIESTILKSAARFKTTILDPKLKEDGTCEVNYTADDGEILALINLAATGRISLRPRNPPQDKFGLTDGGYITRKMDRSRVRFAIDVRPLPSYVYGNPIQERLDALPPPAPPPSTEPGLPPKMPLWIGIHGQLVPQIWDMAVASVIGCVAMRQGLTVEMICRMIRPALNPWEAELLLGWLGNIGVVSRDDGDEGAGWKVNEWWWLILPFHCPVE